MQGEFDERMANLGIFASRHRFSFVNSFLVVFLSVAVVARGFHSRVARTVYAGNEYDRFGLGANKEIDLLQRREEHQI